MDIPALKKVLIGKRKIAKKQFLSQELKIRLNLWGAIEELSA